MPDKLKKPDYQDQPKQAMALIFRDASLLLILLLAILTTVAVLFTPMGSWLYSSIAWLFAADSQQFWWYVTRSAAIIAYLLLWLSTVWGLAVPSKIASPLLDATYTFDFHQFISLLGIGFLLLHVLVLMFDRYLPYTPLQILIPFLSPYRPVWVGIGVISFYIILIVTITFYLRSKIGMNAFRSIHVFSLVGFLGATLHGLFSGTDSALLSMQIHYRVTSLSVLFLTVYWFVQKYLNKKTATASQIPAVKAGSTKESRRNIK